MCFQKKNMLRDNIANLSANSWKRMTIAFDFDGTIVDCKIRQVEVLRTVARRLAFTSVKINLEEWWELKRSGLNTYNALIKIGIDPVSAELITIYWIDLIEKPQWLDLDCIKPGVLSFLKLLKERRNKLYLITARKSEFCLINQLKRLSLLSYFENYFIVNPFNSVDKKKEILNRFNPMIFFGDSETDYYSAQNTSTNFIGISTGQRSGEFLKKVGINTIIANFSDLSR